MNYNEFVEIYPKDTEDDTIRVRKRISYGKRKILNGTTLYCRQSFA